MKNAQARASTGSVDVMGALLEGRSEPDTGKVAELDSIIAGYAKPAPAVSACIAEDKTGSAAPVKKNQPALRPTHAPRPVEPAVSPDAQRPCAPKKVRFTSYLDHRTAELLPQVRDGLRDLVPDGKKHLVSMSGITRLALSLLLKDYQKNGNAGVLAKAFLRRMNRARRK